MGGVELSGFTHIDAVTDPAGFVRLMQEMEAHSDVRRCQDEALDALKIGPGDRILDIGCGPGTAVISKLGEAVGLTGSVVGVDLSEVMVEAARRRFVQTSLPVHFEVADVQSLPFEDATFDACWAERVLCHVPDAAAAIAEMYRVTRPGGRAVALDPDTELTMINSLETVFTRTLIDAATDQITGGRIGRQLPELFRSAGFIDLDVRFVTVRMTLAMTRVFLTEAIQGEARRGRSDRIAGWWNELEEADRRNEFFAAAPVVIVAGARPARPPEKTDCSEELEVG